MLSPIHSHPLTSNSMSRCYSILSSLLTLPFSTQPLDLVLWSMKYLPTTLSVYVFSLDLHLNAIGVYLSSSYAPSSQLFLNPFVCLLPFPSSFTIPYNLYFYPYSITFTITTSSFLPCFPFPCLPTPLFPTPSPLNLPHSQH